MASNRHGCAVGVAGTWPRSQVAKAVDCKSSIPGSNPGGAFYFSSFLFLWLRSVPTSCGGNDRSLRCRSALWRRFRDQSFRGSDILLFQTGDELSESIEELLGIGDQFFALSEQEDGILVVGEALGGQSGEAKSRCHSIGLDRGIKVPGDAGHGEDLKVAVDGATGAFEFLGEGIGIPAAGAEDQSEDA